MDIFRVSLKKKAEKALLLCHFFDLLIADCNLMARFTSLVSAVVSTIRPMKEGF
jgi:hypothetical protein